MTSDALQTQDLTDQLRAHEVRQTEVLEAPTDATLTGGQQLESRTGEFAWSGVTATAGATEVLAAGPAAGQTEGEPATQLIGSPYATPESPAQASGRRLPRRLLLVGGLIATALLMLAGHGLLQASQMVNEPAAIEGQLATPGEPEIEVEAARAAANEVASLPTSPGEQLAAIGQSSLSAAASIPSDEPALAEQAASLAAAFPLIEHPVQDELPVASGQSAPVESEIAASAAEPVEQVLVGAEQPASEAAADESAGESADLAAEAAALELPASLAPAAANPSQPSTTVAQPASQPADRQASKKQDHDDEDDDQPRTRNGQLGITQVLSDGGLTIPFGRR